MRTPNRQTFSGRRSFRWIGVVSACVLLATPAPAADEPPAKRVGVGLVLAGGGARGAAHVGVLEVMEELRIPVDFVVGTSMGSIVGGLYASGFSPEEIREQMLAVDWSKVLVDKAPRRVLPFRRKEEERLPIIDIEFGYGKKNGFSTAGGLISDQHMGFLLEAMMMPASGIDDFDDLPIPFRAVAVDLDSGEIVVMGDGDLTSAIRASMAFPGGFSPVERDGKTLVDGGVLMNLPVEVALDAGAERIIAVDVGTPLSVPTKELSSFGVLRRTYSVMSKQGRQAQRELLREDDLLIVPELEGITAFGGFGEVGTAMERGEEAAREQLEGLRAFSVSEEEFAAFLERQRAGIPLDQIQVNHIRVEGLERVSPQQVHHRLQIRPGETVALEALQEDLDNVFQIGEFQQVGFRLETEDDETTLVVKAKEKPWGPWYFQIGAAIEANFDGIGNFNGLVLARRPEINTLGAEWRSLLTFGKQDSFVTEFYQPLSYAGTWFVQPRYEFLERRRDVLLADSTVIEIDEKNQLGRFDFGYNFKNRAQLLFGYVWGEAKLRTLTVASADTEADVGGARLRFVLDRLDNTSFPHRGDLATVDYLASRDSLGADDEYDRLRVAYGRAFPFDRNTLIATADYSSGLGSDIPVYDGFTLGGFLNLSGFQREILQGNVRGLARLIYYHRFGKAPGLLGGDMYLGGSLETGNVWQDTGQAGFDDLRYSGSVFGGVDTLLGPVYLGYGRADGGVDSFYLFLGRII